MRFCDEIFQSVCCSFPLFNFLINLLHGLRRTRIRLHLLEVIPAGELKGVTTVDIAARVHAIMAADLGAEFVAE